MGQPQVIRGADLQVYINGQLFAVCTGIRWQSDSGRHAIHGIDQQEAFELAPGPVSIRGTIECVRLRQDGGLEGRGVVAPSRMAVLEKYFSLAVVDRSTDTVILAIEKTSAGAQNWGTQGRGILEGSFTFEGIGFTNEADE